jgi:hypothetical protein
VIFDLEGDGRGAAAGVGAGGLDGREYREEFGRHTAYGEVLAGKVKRRGFENESVPGIFHSVAGTVQVMRRRGGSIDPSPAITLRTGFRPLQPAPLLFGFFQTERETSQQQ